MKRRGAPVTEMWCSERSSETSPVIRLAAIDLDRAIELLENEQSRHLMQKRQRRERPAEVDYFENQVVKSSRPPDDERKAAVACALDRRESAGDSERIKQRAFAIERPHDAAGCNPREQRAPFALEVVRLSLHLDHIDRDVRRKTPAAHGAAIAQVAFAHLVDPDHVQIHLPAAFDAAPPR